MACSKRLCRCWNSVDEMAGIELMSGIVVATLLEELQVDSR